MNTSYESKSESEFSAVAVLNHCRWGWDFPGDELFAAFFRNWYIQDSVLQFLNLLSEMDMFCSEIYAHKLING